MCDVCKTLHCVNNYILKLVLSNFKSSTHNGNMGGVRHVTQKALNSLSGQRQVSVQEAVHLVDDLDLVICSDVFTTLSLRQGAMMTGKDDEKAKDIVSMYQKCSPNLHHMSMDEYFYKHMVNGMKQNEQSTKY